MPDGLDKTDYDIYYDQNQQKYIPRRWNNNRGIRSESDFGGSKHGNYFHGNKFNRNLFLAPSIETILHDLEKSSKKQDANSQTVKKVSWQLFHKH